LVDNILNLSPVILGDNTYVSIAQYKFMLFFTYHSHMSFLNRILTCFFEKSRINRDLLIAQIVIHHDKGCFAFVVASHSSWYISTMRSNHHV
ncbi:hypothetical protein, partial [[Clostridium] innocuum]|uniref:hypothetical protein n=1 Tax=Clostridium innocuum TaxID=1522 RepID=UPI0022E2E0A1